MAVASVFMVKLFDYLFEEKDDNAKCSISQIYRHESRKSSFVSVSNCFFSMIGKKCFSVDLTQHQCGTVHDLTASLHTFQCRHPSHSHDLQPRNDFEGGGEKQRRLPPGWSQHSTLRKSNSFSSIHERKLHPFGVRREISTHHGITGCYQMIRGNAKEIVLFLFSV